MFRIKKRTLCSPVREPVLETDFRRRSNLESVMVNTVQHANSRTPSQTMFF